MLCFSPSGLVELRHLAEQIKPYISDADYIQLSSIANSIRDDGCIEERDYSKLISLVENYTKEGNLHLPPSRLENTVEANDVFPDQEDEDIAYISLLNFRYFLLSYAGVNPSTRSEYSRCKSMGR